MVYRLILQTINIYVNIRTSIPFLFLKITNIYSIIQEIKLIPQFFNDFFSHLNFEITSCDTVEQKLKLFEINLFFITQRMCIFENNIEFIEKSLEFYLAKIYFMKNLFLKITNQLHLQLSKFKTELRNKEKFVYESLNLIEIILNLFLSSNQKSDILRLKNALESSFLNIYSLHSSKINDEQYFIILNLGIYFFSFFDKLFLKRNYEINICFEILELAFKIVNYQYKALCVRKKF